MLHNATWSIYSNHTIYIYIIIYVYIYIIIYIFIYLFIYIYLSLLIYLFIYLRIYIRVSTLVLECFLNHILGQCLPMLPSLGINGLRLLGRLRPWQKEELGWLSESFWVKNHQKDITHRLINLISLIDLIVRNFWSHKSDHWYLDPTRKTHKHRTPSADASVGPQDAEDQQ